MPVSEGEAESSEDERAVEMEAAQAEEGKAGGGDGGNANNEMGDFVGDHEQKGEEEGKRPNRRRAVGGQRGGRGRGRGRRGRGRDGSVFMDRVIGPFAYGTYRGDSTGWFQHIEYLRDPKTLLEMSCDNVKYPATPFECARQLTWIGAFLEDSVELYQRSVNVMLHCCDWLNFLYGGLRVFVKAFYWNCDGRPVTLCDNELCPANVCLNAPSLFGLDNVVHWGIDPEDEGGCPHLRVAKEETHLHSPLNVALLETGNYRLLVLSVHILVPHEPSFLPALTALRNRLGVNAVGQQGEPAQDSEDEEDENENAPFPNRRAKLKFLEEQYSLVTKLIRDSDDMGIMGMVAASGYMMERFSSVGMMPQLMREMGCQPATVSDIDIIEASAGGIDGGERASAGGGLRCARISRAIFGGDRGGDAAIRHEFSKSAHWFVGELSRCSEDSGNLNTRAYLSVVFGTLILDYFSQSLFNILPAELNQRSISDRLFALISSQATLWQNITLLSPEWGRSGAWGDDGEVPSLHETKIFGSEMMVNLLEASKSSGEAAFKMCPMCSKDCVPLKAMLDCRLGTDCVFNVMHHGLMPGEACVDLNPSGSQRTQIWKGIASDEAVRFMFCSPARLQQFLTFGLGISHGTSLTEVVMQCNMHARDAMASGRYSKRGVANELLCLFIFRSSKKFGARMSAVHSVRQRRNYGIASNAAQASMVAQSGEMCVVDDGEEDDAGNGSTGCARGPGGTVFSMLALPEVNSKDPRLFAHQARHFFQRMCNLSTETGMPHLKSKPHPEKQVIQNAFSLLARASVTRENFSLDGDNPMVDAMNDAMIYHFGNFLVLHKSPFVYSMPFFVRHIVILWGGGGVVALVNQIGCGKTVFVKVIATIDRLALGGLHAVGENQHWTENAARNRLGGPYLVIDTETGSFAVNKTPTLGEGLPSMDPVDAAAAQPELGDGPESANAVQRLMDNSGEREYDDVDDAAAISKWESVNGGKRRRGGWGFNGRGRGRYRGGHSSTRVDTKYKRIAEILDLCCGTTDLAKVTNEGKYSNEAVEGRFFRIQHDGGTILAAQNLRLERTEYGGSNGGTSTDYSSSGHITGMGWFLWPSFLQARNFRWGDPDRPATDMQRNGNGEEALTGFPFFLPNIFSNLRALSINETVDAKRMRQTSTRIYATAFATLMAMRDLYRRVNYMVFGQKGLVLPWISWFTATEDPETHAPTPTQLLRNNNRHQHTLYGRASKGSTVSYAPSPFNIAVMGNEPRVIYFEEVMMTVNMLMSALVALVTLKPCVTRGMCDMFGIAALALQSHALCIPIPRLYGHKCHVHPVHLDRLLTSYVSCAHADRPLIISSILAMLHDCRVKDDEKGGWSRWELQKNGRYEGYYRIIRWGVATENTGRSWNAAMTVYNMCNEPCLQAAAQYFAFSDDTLPMAIGTRWDNRDICVTCDRNINGVVYVRKSFMYPSPRCLAEGYCPFICDVSLNSWFVAAFLAMRHRFPKVTVRLPNTTTAMDFLGFSENKCVADRAASPASVNGDDDSMAQSGFGDDENERSRMEDEKKNMESSDPDSVERHDRMWNKIVNALAEERSEINRMEGMGNAGIASESQIQRRNAAQRAMVTHIKSVASVEVGCYTFSKSLEAMCVMADSTADFWESQFSVDLSRYRKLVIGGVRHIAAGGTCVDAEHHDMDRVRNREEQEQGADANPSKRVRSDELVLGAETAWFSILFFNIWSKFRMCMGNMLIKPTTVVIRLSDAPGKTKSITDPIATQEEIRQMHNNLGLTGCADLIDYVATAIFKHNDRTLGTLFMFVDPGSSNGIMDPVVDIFDGAATVMFDAIRADLIQLTESPTVDGFISDLIADYKRRYNNHTLDMNSSDQHIVDKKSPLRNYSFLRNQGVSYPSAAYRFINGQNALNKRLLALGTPLCGGSTWREKHLRNLVSALIADADEYTQCLRMREFFRVGNVLFLSYIISTPKFPADMRFIAAASLLQSMYAPPEDSSWAAVMAHSTLIDTHAPPAVAKRNISLVASVPKLFAPWDTLASDAVDSERIDHFIAGIGKFSRDESYPFSMVVSPLISGPDHGPASSQVQAQIPAPMPSPQPPSSFDIQRVPSVQQVLDMTGLGSLKMEDGDDDDDDGKDGDDARARIKVMKKFYVDGRDETHSWVAGITPIMRQIISWAYSEGELENPPKYPKIWYLYTDQMNRIFKSHNFVHLVLRVVVLNSLLSPISREKGPDRFTMSLFSFIRGYLESLLASGLWPDITPKRVEEWLFLTHLSEMMKSEDRSVLRAHASFSKLVRYQDGASDNEQWRRITEWRSFFCTASALICSQFIQMALERMIKRNRIEFTDVARFIYKLGDKARNSNDWKALYALNPVVLGTICPSAE